MYFKDLYTNMVMWPILKRLETNQSLLTIGYSSFFSYGSFTKSSKSPIQLVMTLTNLYGKLSWGIITRVSLRDIIG